MNNELITKIKTRGYWFVRIRPLDFAENRINSLAECKKLIQEAVVLLRGWDYPHIDVGGIISGSDWVESFSDWDLYLEYWRFYKSAQFAHFFSCREDLQNQDDLRRRIYYSSEDTESFLSIISTLYSVTEIFEFSSRLAQNHLFDKGLNISIDLHKMNNRQLFFYDISRAMLNPYICRVENFNVEGNYTFEDITIHSAELALQTTIHIFERFNMDSPPQKLLKEEQQKFLYKST
jgi:hypothetical protein